MDDAFTFTVTVLHAAVTYPSYREAYHSYLILDDDGWMYGWAMGKKRECGSAGCGSANG